MRSLISISALTLLAALPLINRTVAAQEGSETVAAAAKKAFDQGEVELAKGNFAGAATLLKTAVRIQPENALYHHRLGKACLEAEKYAEMWTHFHKAAFLDHANDEFAGDFMKMWMYHDREAVFNCGTPTEIVVRSLGNPDAQLNGRLVYGFMAIDHSNGQVARVTDLRGYTEEAAKEIETCTIPKDISVWKTAHHTVSRRDDNREMTRNGEKIQAWTELLSVQRFPLLAKSSATVRGMADTMHQSLKATDPSVEFVILREQPNSIAYHWRTHATEKHPAQHEIAKIIKGKKDFYRVAYVKKTGRLSELEFSEWSDAISGATLGPAVAKSEAEAAMVNLSSFELGKHLGFAALLRGRHGPDNLIQGALLEVSKHAHVLEVEVPAPPALSDDSSDDLPAAIHYLLDTAGKPIYNQLQQTYGDHSSALYELGTKSTLLSLLYSPGDSTSHAIADAIERSAKKAQLAPSLWAPLVDKTTQGKPGDEVRNEVKRFQSGLGAKLSY